MVILYYVCFKLICVLRIVCSEVAPEILCELRSGQLQEVSCSVTLTQRFALLADVRGNKACSTHTTLLEIMSTYWLGLPKLLDAKLEIYHAAAIYFHTILDDRKSCTMWHWPVSSYNYPYIAQLVLSIWWSFQLTLSYRHLNNSFNYW